MTASGTPATTLLNRRGIAHTVHTYRHDPRRADYGTEAVAALGVPGQRVFKTLVADVDGTMVVAVVPVTGQLNLKALASAVAGKRARLATVANAERATGYVAGGISPLGQRKRLRTVVDSSAQDFDTIYCSAGRRGLEIELTCADLVALTGATVAPVATG